MVLQEGGTSSQGHVTGERQAASRTTVHTSAAAARQALPQNPFSILEGSRKTRPHTQGPSGHLSLSPQAEVFHIGFQLS